MIEINKKGRVKIHWKVTPYDYSKEKEKEIITVAAQKYHIPKENITVSADFIMVNENGEESSITDKVVDNIQDPIFQEKLFKEYLKLNKIENYDYDLILSIDKEINGKIDYQVYDKYRKFSIKWVNFSNFQSYGKNNHFDFTTLHGLVLLNGEPANQSGKTTFAVDLLHFLLFGKSEKADVQANIFNKFLPDETNVIVEGCLDIDGEEYLIKRILTRPKSDKRNEKSKTSQKVEYFHKVGDALEELEDYVESETGESTRATNKIIKEAIGREEDFDLIMCITGSNLDSLINEKPTDRGRLFSRWIGLLPLEEKDALAREKYNTTIKPYLLSNQYDKEALIQEIEAYNEEIKNVTETVKKLENTNSAIEKDIANLEETQKALMESKQNIDTEVAKIDISTVRNNKERKAQEGSLKAQELKAVTDEIKAIGEVDFSVNAYDELTENRTNAVVDQQNKRNECVRLQTLVKQLKTSEYCPTCGHKLENVDNSKQIAEQETNLKNLIEEGKKVTELVNTLNKQIEDIKSKRETYNKKCVLVNKKPVLELNLEKLRNEYKELVNQEKEYIKNSEAIDQNNKIDIAIRNNNVNITTKRSTRDYNLTQISQNNTTIKQYEKEIQNRKDTIRKIKEEEKFVYNWNIYLSMVGKNGISKMVMRRTLPIINARLSQLLDDVCDFDVIVDINNRNEITFKIDKNGIISDINSGSGFEKTASALALRSVLADISTIPRMGGLVLDEIFGRVSKENYEKMHILFDRILKGYDYIFLISHNDEIKDICDTCITVTKTQEGISSIKRQ